MQAAEEKARVRLLELADIACQEHDTQRMVAAAVEGTFFNLIQVCSKYFFPCSARKWCWNLLRIAACPRKGHQNTKPETGSSKAFL